MLFDPTSFFNRMIYDPDFTSSQPFWSDVHIHIVLRQKQYIFSSRPLIQICITDTITHNCYTQHFSLLFIVCGITVKVPQTPYRGFLEYGVVFGGDRTPDIVLHPVKGYTQVLIWCGITSNNHESSAKCRYGLGI